MRCLLSFLTVLSLATPASAETIRAEGKKWTVRETVVNFEKDVPTAPSELVGAVAVYAVHGRDMGEFPDDAVGAIVTRGAYWSTSRDVYVVRGGITNLFEEYVIALARSSGLRASYESRAHFPRIEVDVLDYWIGGGGWTPTKASLTFDLHIYAPGESAPRSTERITRDTTTAPRFGKSGWEQAFEAAVPMVLEALEKPSVREVLLMPAGRAAPAVVPSAGPPGGASPSAGPIRVARVLLTGGGELTGTVLGEAPDGWCLGTSAGERVVPFSGMAAASDWMVDPAGATAWVVLQRHDGSVVSGGYMAVEPYVLATPTGPVTVPPDQVAGALVGSVVAKRAGGLCAAFGR